MNSFGRVILIALFTASAAVCLGWNGQTGRDHQELFGDPWRSTEAKETGQFLSFYYFHPDGDGLYRFGKLGKVLTERFSWSVSGGELIIHFRNTGEKARTTYRVEPARDRRDVVKLTLAKDPRENRQSFSYFRDRPDRRAGRDPLERWQHVVGF